MTQFRESLPSISGPGAYLAGLIFITMVLTSNKSRELAFTLEFIGSLVALSIPMSILITQIYGGLFTRFGYRMKWWSNRFRKYGKNDYLIDNMMDYLCYKKDLDKKGWVIIQKRATNYHLFSQLRFINLGIFIIYIIFMLYNVIFDNVIGIPTWNGIGAIIVIFLSLSSFIVFHLASKNSWEIWDYLDRKTFKDIETDLIKWLEEE